MAGKQAEPCWQVSSEPRADLLSYLLGRRVRRLYAIAVVRRTSQLYHGLLPSRRAPSLQAGAREGCDILRQLAHAHVVGQVAPKP